MLPVNVQFNSAVATPLNSIFIRPRGPSNSTTALATLPGRGVMSSINVAGTGGRAWRGIADVTFLSTFFAGPAAPARSFSLPYSRLRAFAVRLIPCSRASAPAAAHKASGNGTRRGWKLGLRRQFLAD